MAANTNIQIVRGNLVLGGDITTDEVTPTFSVDRQNARVAIGTDASSVSDPYTMYVSGEMYATRLHGDGSQLTGLTDSAWGPAGDDISYVDGDVSIGIADSNGKRLRVHESGNDVLVADGANLRVGVATGSPNANLHVEGNVYVSSNLEVSNINFTGSFNQNGTPFESSPWTTTGNDLSYTTGGVGIGTSPPLETLDVYGGFLVRPERTTTTYSNAWNRSDGNFYYNNTPQYGSEIDVIYSKNAIYTTTGGLKVSPPSNDSEFYYIMQPDVFTPGLYYPLPVSITSPYLSGDVFSSTRFKADNTEDFTGFAVGQDYEAGDRLYDYSQDLDIAKAHSAHMYFKTASPDGSLTEKMRITNTGNVGIGTSSPDANLHVEGNVYVSSNLEVGGANLFVDTQTSRVGLGTRAPEATLHVEGDLNVSSNLEVGGANLFVDTVNSRVGIGTSTPGYTLDVQGDLNVSGTTTNVSDKRLKSNVHVIENALEKVGKLSGYTFTMNNKQNAGVIAQEVLEVLPEVVGGSEETTYSVAYGNMASLFIEAIKELERKVETLENRI